jgi:O-antigen/teichoic acid export membrane protein
MYMLKKKIIISFITLFFVTASNLVMFKAGVHWLRADELGLISVTVSISAILIFFDSAVQSALGAVLIERLAARGEGGRDILFYRTYKKISRYFFILYIVCALVGCGVIFIFRNRFSVDLSALVILWLCFSLGQLPQTITRMCSAYLYSTDNLHKTQTVQALTQICNASVYLLLLAVFRQAWCFGVAYMFSHICASIFMRRMCSSPLRVCDGLEGELSKDDLLLIVKNALPFVGVALAVQLSFGSQSVVIGSIAGLAVVPFYVASSRISSFVLQVCWRPFDADAPRLQQRIASNAMTSVGLVSGDTFMMRACVVLTTVMCLGIYVFNRLFVNLIAKDEFFLGYIFSSVLIVYVFNHTICHFAGFYLNAAGERSLLGRLAIISAVLEVAFSILFVSIWGAVGVLVSSVLVNGFIYGLFGFYRVRKCWGVGSFGFDIRFIIWAGIYLFLSVGFMAIWTDLSAVIQPLVVAIYFVVLTFIFLCWFCWREPQIKDRLLRVIN